MHLIDDNNTFNSLNRKAALHNISSICLSHIWTLKNTYRAPVRLLITGSGEISSTEESTQGNPLTMAMETVRPT